jgi:heptosyltransferase-3
MKTPDSFLIIALRRIGDVLLTTPLIHSIRAAYPEAHIAALVFKGTGGILAGNPDLDAVHEIPARLDWAGYRAFWQEHGRRYAWAVSTQSGDRPTLLAILAGRKRVALLPDEAGKAWWRHVLLNRTVATDASRQHVVQRYLGLCGALGIPAQAKLVAPCSPGFDVVGVLGFDPAAQPFVVCHPMPMFNYKRWPDAQWRSLIGRLQGQGYRVAISGGGGEAEQTAIASLLGNQAGSVVNLAGRLSFAQLAEVLRQASHFYGTDTSVTHLAAATGIPVTAIFGPTDPAIWGPWPVGANAGVSSWQSSVPGGIQSSGNITIVQDTLACVPCQLEGCEHHIHSHSLCLDNMTADKVL